MMNSTAVGEKPADQMRPGEAGLIARFEDMIIAGKLMAMGVLPGARLELVSRNALGYTLIYRINCRFKIALRKDEARTIHIAQEA